jgi:TRAP transporter TAXI family solute receptor
MLKALTFLLILAAPASAQTADAQAAGPARVLTMATGSVTGAYFSAGIALCRVVNETRRDHGLRCAAVPSEGSADNVARLRDGSADLALAQSDTVSDTVSAAMADAAATPDAGLSAVAALFPEPLALVVRGGSGISGLGDLPGKRVSLGPAGGGQRAILDALFAELGWRDTAFAETLELDPAAAVNALCEGRLDAMFYAVGQPALALQEATSSCGATLAPVSGPEVDTVIAGNARLAAAEIPAGLYAGTAGAVPTLAAAAGLYARADADPGEIEVVAGAILDSLPALEGFDRRLAGLDAATMAAGLPAPLHPGAAAAFAARGVALD